MRELRNVIERAVVLSDGEMIVPADLPGRITGSATGPVRRLDIGVARDHLEVKAVVPGAAAERQRIMDALEQCGGNHTRAAKLLGISVRILAHRLAEYNVGRRAGAPGAPLRGVAPPPAPPPPFVSAPAP